MKTRTGKLTAKTFVRIRSLLIRSPWPRGFLLIPLVLGLASIVPGAALACDEICDAYPELNTSWGTYGLTDLTTGTHNTAFGFGVLDSITSEVGNTAVGCNAMTEHKGDYNTAIGRDALYGPSTGSENTATGAFALNNSGDGAYNTANGAYALYDNTTASYNVANGAYALYQNTTGGSNAATGAYALHHNTTASYNVANGAYALYDNYTGSANTACGYTALYNNDGSNNTATGFQALNQNTTGQNNTAMGNNALFTTTTGSNNIGIGAGSGAFLTTGSNNIDIGNSGVTAEANTIRIGLTGVHTNTYLAGVYGAGRSRSSVPVYVDPAGHLGTSTSSARFKEAVKPMDKASEAILALKPVTFKYKKELDPEGTPQFGLVAEEVEKVDPDLVARDNEGKPYTVRYDAVNAMLLNEFLKEHRNVEALAAEMAQQESINAHQQKVIQTLTASLKEQAAQIQKVNAQLTMDEAVARVAASATKTVSKP